VGASVRRKEDPRLLTGTGVFTADVQLPNMLHGVVIRSPFPHAKVKRIDYSEALRIRDVREVLTGREALRFAKPWKTLMVPFDGEFVYPLALERVFYVGQEVAVVVATDMGSALDAAELVQVDYEPLPHVVDLEEALRQDAPRVHDEVPGVKGNLQPFVYRLRAGDAEKAFSQADYTFAEKFTLNMPHAVPIEPSASIASFNRATGQLILWATTQTPHLLKIAVSEILGIPENKVRVIVQDLGGGFGPKSELYAHYILSCILAIKTGQPVKIVNNRRDDFLTLGHRYGQIRNSEIALAKNGRILGWREKIYCDTGAYHSVASSTMALSSVTLAGIYKIENIAVDGYSIYTNKVMGTSFRGFGWPQAVFALERMIDIAASEMNLDPLQIRLLNVPDPTEIPYRSATGPVLDTPNLGECLRAAAKAVGWDDVKAKNEPYRGVGIALMAKQTSGRHLIGYKLDYESVKVRVEPTGSVMVYSSSGPSGQGHETILAQITSDELGVPIDRVTVIVGDTDTCPTGMGTWGSRTNTITVGALLRALTKIKEKLRYCAAHRFETSPDDIVFAGGKFSVRGAPGTELSFDELVWNLYTDPTAVPEGFEPGVSAEGCFDPAFTELFDENGRANYAATYGVNAAAALVEIDPDTGVVRVLDIAIAHDSGRIIHPQIVEGQLQGGMAQGLGMTLMENLQFDSEGQPINTNLTDYLMPTSLDIPDLSKTIHLESIAPRTPLGTRSVGESGIITTPAAVANAVADALRRQVANTLPLTHEFVYGNLWKRFANG